jgi:hypothetical protein
VFEGGFLGLDNIGVFDRSASLPTGGHLEQADGTAWMAFFSQNRLEIAVELAADSPSHQDLAATFIDHVLWIAHAVSNVGPDGISGMFGRNSNWRGPVWMPVNMLLIRALLSFYGFYGG